MRSVLTPQVGGTFEGALSAQTSVVDLPGLCCVAAGGARQQAEVMTLAWRTLYAAAHLLDDVEDGDWAGPAPGDLGAYLNATAGLIESASLALCDLETAGADPKAAQDIRRAFHRTVLAMCAGQHADLTQPERTLEQCWQIAEAKSGAFFALACYAGARLALSVAQPLRAFADFGRQVGMIIQIKNDAGGLAAHGVAASRSDLAAQRMTLPIAYALDVLAPLQREHLRERLHAAAHDAGAEGEARAQIIESGALLYLAVEVERRRRLAEVSLSATGPPSPAKAELLALLNTIATGGAR